VRSTRSTVTFIFTCIIGITPRWHGRPHLIKKMRSICFAPLLALARRGDQPLGAAARWHRRRLLTSDVGRRAYQPASRSSRFPPLAAPENEATQGFSAPSVTPRDLPRESLAVIVGIDSFEVESFFRQASRLMAKVQTGPDGIRKSAASNRGLEVDRVDGARGRTR
jgi:hypothetical protein